MATKILFLTYFFPPIGGSGVQRSIKFVNYLPQLGYLPVVVTAPGASDDRWTPDDRCSLDEIPPQVEVNRIENSYPKESSRSLRIKRLLHMKSNFSIWWINESKALAEKVIARGEIKAIYASMSPFESADVAAYLSDKFSLPWIADLRDPWALREVEIYPSFVHRKIELRKMYLKLLTASEIIMNTPEAGVVLKEKFPELANRITVITNGFDQKDFCESGRNKTSDKFKIVYTGTFYSDVGLAQQRKKFIYKILGGTRDQSSLLSRSPFYLYRALRFIAEKNPEMLCNTEAIFAGVPTEIDLEMVKKSGLSGVVQFTGYLPHSETVKLITSADILFLCMHDVGKGKRATTIGGKDYEYMASGRPILAAVPDGDAKEFLMQCGTAFICRPDDHKEMARILTQGYYATMQKEPIPTLNKEFLKQFQRSVLAERLATVFNKALKK